MNGSQKDRIYYLISELLDEEVEPSDLKQVFPEVVDEVVESRKRR